MHSALAQPLASLTSPPGWPHALSSTSPASRPSKHVAKKGCWDVRYRFEVSAPLVRVEEGGEEVDVGGVPAMLSGH